MNGQMYKQTENFLVFPYKILFWEEPETKIEWIRSCLKGEQKQLCTCGKRSYYESVAPVNHWGGSIETDELCGVTSSSAGLCHIPPSSKGLTASSERPASKCLWTGFCRKVVNSGSRVINIKLRSRLNVKRALTWCCCKVHKCIMWHDSNQVYRSCSCRRKSEVFFIQLVILVEFC